MALLTHVKLANAVKAGPREENFLTNVYYDLDLVDDVLAITCKRTGDLSHTSIYNIIYWKAENQIKLAPRKIVKNVPKQS